MISRPPLKLRETMDIAICNRKFRGIVIITQLTHFFSGIELNYKSKVEIYYLKVFLKNPQWTWRALC